jgi:hypothetical protein
MKRSNVWTLAVALGNVRAMGDFEVEGRLATCLICSGGFDGSVGFEVNEMHANVVHVPNVYAREVHAMAGARP